MKQLAFKIEVKNKGEIHPSIPWIGSAPDKLWTYVGEGEPVLPMKMKHLENGFFESAIHDYAIKDSRLYYFSHVTDGTELVWIIVEWE